MKHIKADIEMLNWPATFLVISIGAAMLGFTNVAGSAIEIAQVLFVVFLVLAVMAFVFGRRLSIKSKNKQLSNINAVEK